MRIAAPAIRWPDELLPMGPNDDATILLVGDAWIGDVGFRVSALRMREGHRTPDYRSDVSGALYEAALDSMADDIEDLIGSLGHELVAIGDARYLLWMVPSPRS